MPPSVPLVTPSGIIYKTLRVFSPSLSVRAFSSSSTTCKTLVRVNQARLWDTIHHTAQWGAHEGGVRRLALTDEDRCVRDWFSQAAKLAGCELKVDQMGNQFAVRPGKDNHLPPIGIGSHLDTQPAGGRFDGILGVLAGLEIVRALNEHKSSTYAPLAVVNWTNEEGARFTTGMLSSAVWVGQLDLEYAYSHTEIDGKTFRDELDRIGYLGETKASFDANPLSAHFELHIEQGPVLEDEQKQVGVVTGVQGMTWLMVTVKGRSQHCGTTPMSRRADALLAACKMISRVNEIAWEESGVTTVGFIESEPQSPGTIPGKTTFSVDVSHLSNDTMAKMEEKVRQACKKLASTGSCTVDIERVWKSLAVDFDPQCIDAVREAASDLVGTEGYRELPAGAGHDSVNTSYRCPTAMVFIPSQNGISHHPSEYSTPEHCGLGAQVLLDAVLKFDRSLESKHGSVS